MADIYSCASRVIIWLGPASPSTVRFLALSHDLKERYKWKPGIDVLEPADDDDIAQYVNTAPTEVTDLLSLPYWRRLWVVQEIWLARRREIYWGSHVLGEGLVLVVLRYLRDDAQLWPLADTIKTLLDSKYVQREDIDYSDILIGKVSSNECSDVRDEIYGLRGLLPREIQKTLSVDYNKDAEEIFLDTVWAYALCQRVHIKSGLPEPPPYGKVNNLAALCNSMLDLELDDEETRACVKLWQRVAFQCHGLPNDQAQRKQAEVVASWFKTKIEEKKRV